MALNQSISLCLKTKTVNIILFMAAGDIAILPGSIMISPDLQPSMIASLLKKLLLMVMWKDHLCLSARGNIILCGQKAGGPAPITALPMPWAILHLGPLNELVKYCNKTPLLLVAPAIILLSIYPVRMNVTLFTTADHSVKQMRTHALFLYTT